MSRTTSLRRQDGSSDTGLLIALVIVSYVITFSMPFDSPTPLKYVLLIAAGIAYTLMGMYGSRYVERSDSSLALAAYFCLLLALGTTIFVLSEARGWLLLLPVAAGRLEEGIESETDKLFQIVRNLLASN